MFALSFICYVVNNRQTYLHRGGPLVGLTVCDQGQSLASSASESGTVFILRVEPNSSKMSLMGTRQLDLEVIKGFIITRKSNNLSISKILNKRSSITRLELKKQEEGYVVDLHYLDSGSQSVLVYASLYGYLVGWDLRCPGTTWRLENDVKHGVITSFCVNSQQQWLTLGTSSGIHTCWDLRFQLPITSIKHPTGIGYFADMEYLNNIGLDPTSSKTKSMTDICTVRQSGMLINID